MLILSKLSASQDDASRALTEHPGGIITEGTTTIPLEDSPYWMQNDLIVEQNAKLVIEPGVRINFEPQIGITVRGVLIAEVRTPFINLFTRFYLISVCPHLNEFYIPSLGFALFY